MNIKVLIEVRGNIAQVVMATAPLDVVIVDIDDMAHGEQPALAPATIPRIVCEEEFNATLEGIHQVWLEGFKIV